MTIMTAAARREAPNTAHVSTKRLRDDLWRVSSASGIALGYIAHTDTPTSGGAFEARRLLPGSTKVMTIGGGWSVEEALVCFSVP